MADSVRQMLCPGCAAGGLPPAESVGPAEEAGICGESLHVANLLTAPDSGANTRHKIAGKIKQGGQKVKDTLEEGYHSMQHSMQE